MITIIVIVTNNNYTFDLTRIMITIVSSIRKNMIMNVNVFVKKILIIKFTSKKEHCTRKATAQKITIIISKVIKLKIKLVVETKVEL